MEHYWAEFLTVVVVHFLAVASPGPDFAIIVRQSLCFGSRTAVITSLGIGVGILVHVTYSLLGLGLLIAQSTTAFTVLKIVGAGYLLYVGVQCLRAGPQAFNGEGLHAERQLPSAWQAFKLGFLTNVLNAKATLFFVALFSVVISPQTPALVQAGYGVWMTLATALWFIGLSLFFASGKVRRTMQRCGHWIERTTGVALIGLAGKLALTSQ